MSSNELRRVGFIGLGMMGMPMARAIERGGYPLSVWARRPEILEVFGPEVTRSQTPAALAAQSDVICICTFDAQSVEEVLFGTDGVASGVIPGTPVLIHSTVSPEEVVAIAKRGAELGLVIIDAPVSGGAPAVEAGALTTMLGGSEAACDAARDVLATHSGRIVRLGDVGAGQKAKLINNALLSAQSAVANAAFELAQRIGLERAPLLEVLTTGSGRSFAIEMVGNSGKLENIANGQAYPTLAKDARLLRETAGSGSGDYLIDVADHFIAEMTAVRTV